MSSNLYQAISACRAVCILCAALLVCVASPGASHAFGTADNLELPRLNYDSPSWEGRQSGLRRLLLEVELRTSILVNTEPSSVRLRAEELFRSPIVIMTGDREFPPWSADERALMRTFLNAGGTWVIDSAEARVGGGFERSVRRELAAILPERELAPLPHDHVILRSFYLMDDTPGRLLLGRMEAISHDGRMAVIYSHNDMMGAWARDRFGAGELPVHPGGERQRELAMRLGINLIMYILTVDYKDDQVHIPFILQRRRWRTR